MTDHEHAEISRRLALAIGWKASDGRIYQDCKGHECVKIRFYPSSARQDYFVWRRFDYRDPAVIWPIAERFEAFPRSSITGSVWLCRTSSEHRFEMADTAALAVARAVIAAKEKA